MKVKIYQVNTQRDKNKVKFLGLDQIRKYQGTENVDATLYDEVFSGDVACKNPEDVYALFNTDIPPLHRGHSLSVSDVVKTEEGCFYCDRVGFKQIDFDESGTQKPANLLKVVYVEPGKPAYAAEIEDTLKAKQRAVGGMIELVNNGDGTAIICNEEGKLEGLPANRRIEEISDVIVGNFFVVGLGEENFRSLTDEETEKYLKRFECPEEIEQEEVEESIAVKFYSL